MRVLVKDVLAMIIDYQSKLVPVMTEKDSLLRNSLKLIKGLQILHIPMVVTQQYTKGLGETIQEIQNILETETQYYEKVTFSSMEEENIKIAVAGYEKKTLLVCGIEAHVCVLQTVIDAIEAGYQVVVVKDCISSRNLNDMEIALLRMQQEGALITTSESILFELTRQAGDEIFKQILKLVK